MIYSQSMSEENANTAPPIIQPYMVVIDDVKAERDKLSAKLEELTSKIDNAESINNKLRSMHDSLTAADIGEDAIKAALVCQFGKPKGPRKPRSPNRTDKNPTAEEMKVLSVLTDEPMKKSAVFSSCHLPIDSTTTFLLPNMARFGWIRNAGGKGAGAGWVITEEGKKLVNSAPAEAMAPPPN